MAIDYEKAARKAAEKITQNGKMIGLVRADKTPSDTDRPWRGSSSPLPGVDLEVPGIVLMPNAVRVFGLSALGDATELDNLIAYTEKVYMVAQGENDLKQYSLVRDEGVYYSILATQTLRPANTTILGFIGTRR